MITQEQIKATIERAEKQIEEMKELLKTVEAEQGSRRVEVGEIYWFVDDKGQICSTKEEYSYADNYRYESGNYYLSPEDAERAEKQIRLFRILDRFSRQNGWTDELWKERKIAKYYIYFDSFYKNIEINSIYTNRQVCQVYFTSGSVAQKAIEKYHDLIMEVMAI